MNIEATLVKITTASGEHGWGEIHEPIVPEVGATIVERLLAPLLIGKHIEDIANLRRKMYRMMHVRGHTHGFMLDAIGGLDIALWDLNGKVNGEAIGTMLGGKRRDRLSAYVSVPGVTPEQKIDQAKEYIDEGFDGVKLFGGHGIATDVEVVSTIRDEIGPEPKLLLDCFWSYTSSETERLDEKLRGMADVIEAPLQPEDVDGHSRVAEGTSIPIGVGEPFRTSNECRRWLEVDALDVLQPDIVLTGLTEGKRINDLGEMFGRKIAPHYGAGLGIGMAATWQYSSHTPQFFIQEHQPRCLEETNEFLSPTLEYSDGELLVPDGPGLGIDVDEDALAQFVTDSGVIETDQSE